MNAHKLAAIPRFLSPQMCPVAQGQPAFLLQMIPHRTATGSSPSLRQDPSMQTQFWSEAESGRLTETLPARHVNSL
jgi:hypothetical protein